MKDLNFPSISENLFLNHLHSDLIFQAMERQDYILLYAIRRGIETSPLENAAYLSDLAEMINVTIAQMSRFATKLQDKGYINWQTDMEQERTYLSLTGKGRDVLETQRKLMEEGHRRIVEEVDPQRLAVTIDTMHTIADIIRGLEE